jgi:hypothetical protein
MIEIQRDDGEVVTIRSLETIGRLLDRGGINESTLVRNQGESDFIHARDHSGIAEVASLVGKPFPRREIARPIDQKIIQTHPAVVSAKDNASRPVEVKPISTSRRKPTKPPATPYTVSQKSPWTVSDGSGLGLENEAPVAVSPGGPTASRGVPNKPIHQTLRFHEASALRAAEPPTSANARQPAPQESNSPSYGAVRAFGGALICHLISFGVGVALASIGSRLPSAGAFVFFGAAVSALLGFHLGQKLYSNGARSSKAVGLAVFILLFLALDIAGLVGLIVAAASGAAVFLGWKSTKQA